MFAAKPPRKFCESIFSVEFFSSSVPQMVLAIYTAHPGTDRISAVTSPAQHFLGAKMVDQHFHRLQRERKIAQFRAEDEARAKAAKPKPQRQSSFDDVAFCDRVIERAEKRERILAKIRSGNFKMSPPKAAARVRWAAAVAKALMQCENNRQRAVAMVASKYPKLRQRLIAEANAR